MTYYIRGAIVDDFFIVGVDAENTSYIFSGTGSSAGFYYTSNFTSVPGYTPVRFNYKHSTLQTGKEQFSLGASGVVLSSTIKSNLTLKPLNYNVKGIVAGEFYSLLSQNGLPVSLNIITNSTTIPSISRIRFVPFRVYEASTCNSTIKTLDSELAWLKDPTKATSFSYTNLPDCKAKDFYDYCLLDTFCGFNNCKGPCQIGNCVLKDGKHRCESSKIVITTKVNRTDLGFVIATVVILLLILMSGVVSSLD